MDKNQISRKLSYALRHAPESLGITLDSNGWTDVSTLLEKLQITFGVLKQVVEENDKQRFSFNQKLSMIRANQGHSVKVNLGYEPKEPPEYLYHGTTTESIGSIFRSGLNKGSRHHVHLSSDHATAIKVGKRHGFPQVLKISTLEHHRAGGVYYLSENLVWLVEFVPAQYIEII